ncbi:PREDICTED: uncharacterized protein LOC109580547 [Amphimedon queenslandica]|uniref:G-protein coupled receptors family 2 profile 2 domain-containing protein n=1 Tax=Amphimedon queenslandica TaxID=400682 RepID=A0AAN0IY84_AMPQE|nr:PREDICTED: uncharacterized protein LOC109580547 [Amphimedon queenslandica]|eukprot:XP_019849403.1 PREDICTED: uncharacterized protein LOC109580547 [Amphimedon queenslandica]
MTVFIAAQGIIIFILYVLLSKQVRAAYSKWWKDKKANSQVLNIFTSKASFPLHSPNQTKDFKTHSNSNHYESSFNEKSDAILKSVASINEIPSPIATQEFSLVFGNKEFQENDSEH